MSNEPSPAFGDLEARLSAFGGELDRISLRDYCVEVEIGAFQVERDVKQPLKFSVVVEVAPQDQPESDDVDKILSYDQLKWAIDHELAAERLNLLETLAERIADRILHAPQAMRVFLRIEKTGRGPGDLGVEVVRTRGEAGQAEEDSSVRPTVYVLAASDLDARSWAKLRATIADQPAVLCIGAQRSVVDAAISATAQRHVDLLAVEQAAWRLAGLDDRLDVVATRTELDWSIRNNRLAIWAPSKMVFDAVDGPMTADPLELARWLAGQLGAADLVELESLAAAAPIMSSADHIRPLAQLNSGRTGKPADLAGSRFVSFAQVDINGLVDAQDLPDGVLRRLGVRRPDLCGLRLDRPLIMGIVNVTPDSFSDGGDRLSVDAALAAVRQMQGADILDIGGESTRPGADPVPVRHEIARVVPVIRAIRESGIKTPISIDTRKAAVAEAALQAGADMVNDVSALSFDAEMGPLVAERDVPVCLMHALGDPKTMQDDPTYDDVSREVYDYLLQRIEDATSKGINRQRIIVDPGIGFGKTKDHNLKLLRDLSMLHNLGVPVLLGASRKRFIGTIGDAAEAKNRMPGSLAVALHGAAQGAHIIRVHDVAETRQALNLWQAMAEQDECWNE